MVEEETAEVALPQGEYFTGTGRRKTAIARVRLYPGSGSIHVNDRPYLEVFPRIGHRVKVQKPLALTETADRFDVYVKVEGGGVSAWADALAHGIARALVDFDPNLKPTLRKAGLVTRDPRVKERKKYGLKRARKAPQYTKR
ncbi:MAG: 30S ribosomal protein S9 [Chloroflexi bacterium]|nr:30S ribosomal protein S9 [Chloroflexota bacterium]